MGFLLSNLGVAGTAAKGFAGDAVGMASSRAKWWSPLVLCTLLLSACITIPIQEMSDARQGIASAEELGAEHLVPHSYNSAVRLMTMAETALAEKDYAQARQAANEARNFALRARRLTSSFGSVSAVMSEANGIGAPLAEAEALFAEANSAAHAGDEARAAELLLQAEASTIAAMQKTYAEQARLLIDESAALARSMSLPQQSTLQAARGALGEGDVERAYRISYGLALEMRARNGNGG